MAESTSAHKEQKYLIDTETSFNLSITEFEMIGSYKLISKIGSGSIGKVFLAKHPTLNTDVALKLVQKDPEAVSSALFTHEAKIAAKINHENITTILDLGCTEDHQYIVMEYVSGGNLGELLQKEQVLSPLRAVEIIEDICLALIEAERYSIVHRDIKPENILLTERGRAKLADLGLAREIHDLALGIELEEVTQGTPEYMSPEQSLNPKKVDHRSDLYSLGVTFYQLICGKVPFTAANSIEVLMKHVNDKPASPQLHNSKLDREICRIALKLLRKDPDMRYQSANDLLKDIQSYKSSFQKNKKDYISNSSLKFLNLFLILLLSVNLALYISEPPQEHNTEFNIPPKNTSWIHPTLKLNMYPLKEGVYSKPGNIQYVQLSSGWISSCITLKQYKKITGKTPIASKSDLLANISWYDAREFCITLTNMERADGHLPEGYIYKLPTLSQWESSLTEGQKSNSHLMEWIDDCESGTVLAGAQNSQSVTNLNTEFIKSNKSEMIGFRIVLVQQ